MVGIMKRYVWAERSGNWTAHLNEIENMLPYIVSAGHRNYMSCLPIYLNDMRALPEKAPEVHEAFLEGKFTIH